MIPFRRAAAAVLAMTLATGAAQAQPAPSIYGTWMNPRGSVAVRTGQCAQERLCGVIVWANDEAQSDARDGGVTRLVGTALLEDYRADGSGGWQGTVFIPDMNRRFYSKIEQVDANTMKLKGCILGGLICKAQLWKRIERLPHE
ncbi:MAG: DUF2147 domain-containing protein [Sphingomonas adhaesiva]|uniref:DUF2147 domain-containing protein n=1 Tax=Sphingomonas adhaesiva TaxID=28212 RepID=UPI002FF9C44D